MERLQEYAQLLIQVGVNIKPGQKLVIVAPVLAADLAHRCVDAAYDRGAAFVYVHWIDDHVTRAGYLHGDATCLDAVEPGYDVFMNTLAEAGAAFLHLTAKDPELLAGVDSARVMRASRASGKALKPYRAATGSNRAPWCVAALPCAPWAKRVFPELSESDAIDALWEAIYTCVRVHGRGDAAESWQAHLVALQTRARKMDAWHFHKLHYQAQGTDLWVELPATHLWGCSDGTFVANMPTEEIGTSPLRTGVEGEVTAVMPFVLNGVVVDGMHLVFREGRVVEATARTGQAALDALLEVDEGSRYLGEAALVSHTSPIRQTGRLFYNTLFDENASCHLALGFSYPSVVGGNAMTQDELAALGLNQSMSHVDFMVGGDDLQLTGIQADGTVIPLFVDGKMVF